MAVSERSALSPFRHTVFLVLWTGIVLSNVGTWMHDVAAGWLMATLTTSPILVAAVQAATTLPVFVFSLSAGALADIVDRRRLLIVVKLGLSLVAVALAGVTFVGSISPTSLLIFTFAMGTGAAFIAPAWQAVVPQLVPKEDLQQAIALNSVGINISRAVGPALGGAIIAGVGIAYPFMVNAVSFLVVVVALVWWTPTERQTSPLPSERFASAIRTGLRYARESGPLRSTVLRAVGFFGFATAYWALLPLIARDLLGGGSSYYGFVMGGIGAGAVITALALPKLRSAFGPNKIVAGGTFGTAGVLVLFAISENQILGVIASMLAGGCWIAVLTSFNVSAQLALPEWVRARGLSIMIAVYFGAMAGGSVLWGALAGEIGIPNTLLIAAGLGVVSIIVTGRYKLLEDLRLDLSPSTHWNMPVVHSEIDDDRGPVMVTMEWRVDPEKSEEFALAMDALGRSRRRDGAFDWGLYEDTSEPGLFLEYFLVDSWLDHMRQHERVTAADQETERNIIKFQLSGERPRARHFVAPRHH